MSGIAKTLAKRQEIPKQYQWAVEDVYADDATWEADFAKVQAMISDLAALQGSLNQSAAKLLAALKTQETMLKAVFKVAFYAGRRKDEDNTNSLYVAMSDRARSLAIQLNGAMSWFTPELLSLPVEQLEKYLGEEPELATYCQLLDEIMRRKPHVLSAEQEYLLAQVDQVSQGPATIFSMLNNADLKFPTIRDEKGQEVEVTKGRFVSFLQSPDRRVRKDAFTAAYSTYRGLKNTIAATLGSSIKGDAFYAQTRNYESSLHAATFPDNVPVEVYDNLIATVHNNLDKMHAYVSLRKQALQLDELHMYDIYVPIVKDFQMGVNYQDACAMVIDSLAPFGPEYQNIVRRAVSERWIDVYENVGKTSGAYSAGVYGVHPYMLLNFQDDIQSTFTLAHELGHSLHTYLTLETQPFIYADYSLFVAEVASTVHEVLLTHYLLSITSDPQERAYYLNNYLEGFRGTVFRQTMFAEFEREVHARSAAGQALTADMMCDIYYDLNVKYHGPDMVVDQDIAMEWARIPHFYRAFYVYKYATGYSAAVALAKQILTEGAPAVERYLGFLRSGSSDYPLNVLHKAGVDMSSPAPIQSAMDEFGRTVDELKELLNC
ncbi:MAG TPA: oligoendopeptidase F [Firmicutes bacterium]|nr:oligoendopeptidase F [Bacillota bacterium]